MKKYGTLVIYHKSYWPALVHFMTFIYKRTLFALSLILLIDYPLIQLSIYLTDQLGDTLFLAIVRPYKDLHVNLLTIFNEFLCLIAGLYFLDLLYERDRPQDEKLRAGRAYVAIIYIHLAVNLIVICTFAGIELYKIIKERFRLNKLKTQKTKIHVYNTKEPDDGKELDEIVQDIIKDDTPIYYEEEPKIEEPEEEIGDVTNLYVEEDEKPV